MCNSYRGGSLGRGGKKAMHPASPLENWPPSTSRDNRRGKSSWHRLIFTTMDYPKDYLTTKNYGGKEISDEGTAKRIQEK